ncbi:Rrf2 family transcriptional regulator [Clostridium sp. Sa3CUN1]|uniref:Rrf2 family transcriptional regulator n=1 Tax=Clostridium gallinarum TaxID=2762246 RepID=A0ABR8Q5Y9_9CLOT|nr:Rrf2 family transcriptional regulator [Clostridium gallinarum]MBD7915824.1 Rrf2 family transcriptional regulator [Clostridium gallinarum]
MQISSRFTIAIHIFSCIYIFQKDYKITSDFIASSVNVNPVIIRKILSQLKSKGLVEVQRGSGGASISKPLEEITFFDIYNAVECIDNGQLFHFHENPNQNCPVGRNIHNVLDIKLTQIQNTLEEKLKRITLADVMKDTQYYILKEKNNINY